MSRITSNTKQTTMRLPNRTIERLKKQALIENRSVTNMTVTLLEEGLTKRLGKRTQQGAADVLA